MDEDFGARLKLLLNEIITAVADQHPLCRENVYPDLLGIPFAKVPLRNFSFTIDSAELSIIFHVDDIGCNSAMLNVYFEANDSLDKCLFPAAMVLDKSFSKNGDIIENQADLVSLVKRAYLLFTSIGEYNEINYHLL